MLESSQRICYVNLILKLKDGHFFTVLIKTQCLADAHLGAHVVQPLPVKSCWLIMQENALCHMWVWRQLTDLICWVPVTCCRTFSSSFSMRPAQWIILENKNTTCSTCILSTLSPEHIMIMPWHFNSRLNVSECMCTTVREMQIDKRSLSPPQFLCISLSVVKLPHSPPFRLTIWKYPSPISLNVSVSHQHLLHLSHHAYIWSALAGLEANVPVWALLGSAALQ